MKEQCPNCGSTIEPESKLKPCAICGEFTEWLCADCAISHRSKTPICHKPECREKHELTHPEVSHV